MAANPHGGVDPDLRHLDDRVTERREPCQPGRCRHVARQPTRVREKSKEVCARLAGVTIRRLGPACFQSASALGVSALRTKCGHEGLHCVCRLRFARQQSPVRGGSPACDASRRSIVGMCCYPEVGTVLLAPPQRCARCFEPCGAVEIPDRSADFTFVLHASMDTRWHPIGRSLRYLDRPRRCISLSRNGVRARNVADAAIVAAAGVYWFHAAVRDPDRTSPSSSRVPDGVTTLSTAVPVWYRIHAANPRECSRHSR